MTTYKQRPSRRDRAGMVQLDLNAEELAKLDTLMEAHGLRSRAAYFRHLLRVQPTPPKPRPPLSPVRLVDGRWVNADETTPEHRHTAADERPGEGYRNFPCLPLPDPPPPASEEMAPWDDPTAMSYEELGELVGL